MSCRKMRQIINNGSIVEADHYALIIGGCWGYGYVDTFNCHDKGSRTSVNCMSKKKDEVTARIIAHEYGHQLGMAHDQGRKCERGGIMSYKFMSKEWSNCSRNDLLNFYNAQGGKDGTFCLNPNGN